MGSTVQKSYTLADQERAIALVYKLNSYASASRVSGIPETNIKRWAHRADDSELAEIRKSIRTEIVQMAWSLTFRSLAISTKQIEQFEKRFDVEVIAPELLTPEAVRTTVEVGERIARTMRHLGAVAQKLQVSGEIEHILKDKETRDITPQDIALIGRDFLNTRGRRN